MGLGEAPTIEDLTLLAFCANQPAQLTLDTQRLEDWVAALNAQSNSPSYPEPRGKRAADNDPKGRNCRTSIKRSPRHTVLGI